jgi:hypothetical protein
VVNNPNWPTLFAEADFAANPFYASSLPQIYTDLTPRLYQSWSVHRGRQFELDQIQPAEWSGQWRNRDGALDPSNASSPLSPYVLPYRGYRVRAQYPSSINLLTGDVATGGEYTPLPVGTPLGSVTSHYNTPVATASSSAWQGTQVWDVLVNSGTAGSALITVGPVPIQVGQTGLPYTPSMYIRSATTSANPTIRPFLTWLGVSGSTISTTTVATVNLTGSPTGIWVLVSVPDVVPAGAVAAQFGVTLTSAPAGSWDFQADGIQFEQNASASVFSFPGTNYPIYAGLVERYPQSWTNQGTYGLVVPIGVDAMAPLSQNLLQEAFIMDVAASGPAWFYPLNDATGSTTFVEQAGRYPAAGTYSSSVGAGTLTVGNSITATTTAGKFLGTNGPVATINNPNPNQGTVIDLSAAGIVSAPSTGAWTRMIAFRYTGPAVGTPVLAAYTPGVSPFAAGYYSNMYLEIEVSSGTNMVVAVSFYNAAGQLLGLAHTTVINDGNWHLAFVQMSADGKTISLWVDGTSTSTTGANDMHPTLAINESVGGDEYKFSSVVGPGQATWVGDVALYAQWNSALTGTQMLNLYTSWRSAWQGDSTDARYSRILGWAGYTGPSSIAFGSTTSLGPATDVSGSDALTCLSNVVDTEAGRHFVAADGTMTFQSRKTQFANTTPKWTFGENAGEIPYVNLTFDFDPTHLSNNVTVTQTSTNQLFYAVDPVSQSEYGPRTLTRNSQATSVTEVQQSAFFWLAKYAQPALRVAAIRIDAGSNGALFPSVLAFEIGQRVRINRRDAAGLRPTITTDGYIEQVTHTADSSNSWLVDLEISPAPANAYGVFTTLQTTLHAGSSSGSSTININALPDAATNPAAANLTGGQQLTIGSGASLEVVTIAPGGVQTTSPGYTNATITLTATLAHSHSTGDSVQADPSPQYYNASMFGSSQFCF